MCMRNAITIISQNRLISEGFSPNMDLKAMNSKSGQTKKKSLQAIPKGTFDDINKTFTL